MKATDTPASIRLRQLIAFTGLNMSQFAKSIGDNRTDALTMVIQGRTASISESLIFKIRNAYPYISKEWLASGSGEMISSHLRLDRETLDRISDLLNKIKERQQRLDKLIDMLTSRVKLTNI